MRRRLWKRSKKKNMKQGGFRNKHIKKKKCRGGINLKIVDIGFLPKLQNQRACTVLMMTVRDKVWTWSTDNEWETDFVDASAECFGGTLAHFTLWAICTTLGSKWKKGVEKKKRRTCELGCHWVTEWGRKGGRESGKLKGSGGGESKQIGRRWWW